MRVEYLTDGDAARWDAYVEPRAAAVTDLFAWRFVVREAYGMRSHFLAAVDGDQIVGTLALFEIRHPLFGHYFATAVFGTDGGLNFDSDAARDALVAEARALAAREGVAYTLIRARSVELGGGETDRRYSTALMDLTGDPESVWRELPSKTRNQVRRGMKEGFLVSAGDGELAPFFDVFHRHMRALGSPAHGIHFYEAIQRHFASRAEFLVVRDPVDTKQVVGGALVFYVNGVASNYHSVTLREFNTRCANYLLYWRIVELAIARGCRQLDMGRSETNSSQLAFKKNWTSRVEPLQYHYLLAGDRAAPRIDPHNPRYRLAIAFWKRLPLFLTRALGPRLISGIA
jgi:FemAB-related protein (PEP-CTERM system-associated)